MPVTAKLSRKFYEKFGDDLTNELVNWMNQVDATYRTEFRDLFEVHFGRFDAKLEQRVAQLDAKFDQRVTQLEARFDQRVTQLEGRLDQGIAQLDGTLEQRMAKMETRIERMKSELLRWNFLFWIGTLGTVVALLKL